MADSRESDNIAIVRQILQDEIVGDVESATSKLDPHYTMTWMYQAPKTRELFPRSGRNFKEELKSDYAINGREYDIKHIAERGDTVFVELVESYPDPKTGKVYRTPLVLVLEMRDGRIVTGRHYCDPNLSYLYLAKDVVDAAIHPPRQ